MTTTAIPQGINADAKESAPQQHTPRTVDELRAVMQKPSHSLEVTEVEADLVDSIRAGRLLPLTHDYPEYLADARRDGISEEEIVRTRTVYVEQRDSLLDSIRDFLQSSAPGERMSGCTEELTETEQAVIDALRHARRCETSWESYDQRESFRLIEQVTHGILRGETFERLSNFADPEDFPVIYAAASCVAQAVRHMMSSFRQEREEAAPR